MRAFSHVSAWNRARSGRVTREAAEAAPKTLSANGIADVYLMSGSDPPNVLSLGVFSASAAG
jgi:hypothetical protein